MSRISRPVFALKFECFRFVRSRRRWYARVRSEVIEKRHATRVRCYCIRSVFRWPILKRLTRKRTKRVALIVVETCQRTRLIVCEIAIRIGTYDTIHGGINRELFSAPRSDHRHTVEEIGGRSDYRFEDGPWPYLLRQEPNYPLSTARVPKI